MNMESFYSFLMISEVKDSKSHVLQALGKILKKTWKFHHDSILIMKRRKRLQFIASTFSLLGLTLLNSMSM